MTGTHLENSQVGPGPEDLLFQFSRHHPFLSLGKIFNKTKCDILGCFHACPVIGDVENIGL